MSALRTYRARVSACAMPAAAAPPDTLALAVQWIGRLAAGVVTAEVLAQQRASVNPAGHGNPRAGLLHA